MTAPPTDSTRIVADRRAFSWPPVLAVALATFCVVTAEMMPVGVLTPIADALGVAPGAAGSSLTITGIVAAVVASLSPVLSGRLDRRTLLVAFLVVLAVANALSALATGFAVFALGRVLIGVSMGFIWANSASMAVRLSDEATVGRAMTTVFAGISVGMVLGLPAGTFIAALADWRASLWAVAGLAAAAAAFAAVTLPALPVAVRPGLAGLVTPWRDRGVRIGYAITALVVIGQFASYTFIRPVLETGAGVTDATIVIALAAFGVAGIGGNLAVGAMAARDPRVALLVSLVAIALGPAALPLVVDSVPAVFAVLIVWGAAYGGISVATQAWNRAANPSLVHSSSAMLSGVFNASIAVGSFVGGLVFDALGGTVIMIAGAAVVAVGWLLVLASRPRR